MTDFIPSFPAPVYSYGTVFRHDHGNRAAFKTNFTAVLILSLFLCSSSACCWRLDACNLSPCDLHRPWAAVWEFSCIILKIEKTSFGSRMQVWSGDVRSVTGRQRTALCDFFKTVIFMLESKERFAEIMFFLKKKKSLLSALNAQYDSHNITFFNGEQSRFQTHQRLKYMTDIITEKSKMAEQRN